MFQFNNLADALRARRLRNKILPKLLLAVYRFGSGRRSPAQAEDLAPPPASIPVLEGPDAGGTSARADEERAAPLMSRPMAVGFWAGPTCALFLVVLCTWTGPFNDRMSLGGDDGHLYYMDPMAWLRNAPLTTLDGGILGYNSRVYMVPFLLVLRGLQLLGLNAQGAALGFLVALGWAGTTALVLCAVGRRDATARGCAAVAGLVAVLAPTVASTQYVHLLLGVYWIALLPWLLFLAVRHQQTGRRSYLLAAVVATVLGAPAIAQVPWTLGVLPTAIGVFAVLGLGRTFRFSLRRLLAFSGVILLANAWWLIPTAVGLGGAQTAASAATSSAGSVEAYRIIKTLAPVQNPLDALELRQSHRQQISFDSVALAVDRIPRTLWPVGLVPALTAAGGLVVAVWRRRPSQRLLIGCGGLVIVNLFLITVRVFGLHLGLAIYRGLLSALPPLAGVRNFYDRFAIAFAASVALAFGLALAELLRTAKPPVQSTAIIFLGTALLVYGYPGLVGQQVRLPQYPGFAQNRMMNGLPAGYLDLVKRLDHEPPGPVLTLPLLIPNWSTVADPSGSAAYVGISPMIHLTGRTEYNGLDSFNSAAAPELRAVVEQALHRGDARALVAIVKELAVQWIAVQRDPGPDGTSYRVGVPRDPGVDAPFQQSLLAAVAPEVVGTYGTYELRRVQADVRRPLLGVAPAEVLAVHAGYLTERAAGGPEPTGACSYGDVPLQTADRSQTHYKAGLDPNHGGCALVLRTAYDGAWSAVARVGGRAIRLKGQRALGFATGWILPPGATEVTVRYERQALLLRSAAVSSTFIPLAGLGLAQSLRRRRRRRSPSASPGRLDATP